MKRQSTEKMKRRFELYLLVLEFKRIDLLLCIYINWSKFVGIQKLTVATLQRVKLLETV
jgi:hypothetical protein